MRKGKVNNYNLVPKYVHVFIRSSEMLFGFVIKDFDKTHKKSSH